MKIQCDLYNLAGKLVDYQLAWKYQKSLMERMNTMKKKGSIVKDSILFVQHPHIYTLGRGATEKNLKFKSDATSEHQVLRVERGGEVTWHGPGQLVAYPIFDLNNHKRDLHWFTSRLEQTVIDTLHTQFVKGERSDVNTGVWVGTNKISAVGVTASRWITMHGIAFNVNCNMSNYDRIVPCGIAVPGRGVCSLQQLISGRVSAPPGSISESENDFQLATVSQQWISAFADVFSLDLQEQRDPSGTLSQILSEYPDILNGTLPSTISQE